MENDEARRMWTLGKLSLLWERKHKRRMGDRQMMALVNGDWKPDDITTEELVEELRKDPYHPSKLVGVKRAVGPKVRRGQLTLSEG